MAHDEEEHHGSTEPPGLVDIIIGAIVFIGLAELIYLFMSAAVPDVGMTREHLHEIQISGLLFIAVWRFIGNGVFLPFFEAFSEREERTTGAQRKALELRREQQDVEAKIAEQLQEARLVGIRQRDGKIDAAKRRAQEILDAAGQRNDEKLRNAADRLQEMRRAAERELAAEADKLADEVAERVLAAESTPHSIH